MMLRCSFVLTTVIATSLLTILLVSQFTAHTTNPVPFVLVNCHKAKGLEEDGKLCDIAPTLLDMMDLEQPKEMTGHSLLM